MENLNDLIWTDEDDNGGCDAQSTNDGPPMAELCMVSFCTIINPPSGPGGGIDFTPIGYYDVYCGI